MQIHSASVLSIYIRLGSSLIAEKNIPQPRHQQHTGSIPGWEGKENETRHFGPQKCSFLWQAAQQTLYWGHFSPDGIFAVFFWIQRGWWWSSSVITRPQPFLCVLIPVFASGTGNPASQDIQLPLCIHGHRNGLRSFITWGPGTKRSPRKRFPWGMTVFSLTHYFCKYRLQLT